MTLINKFKYLGENSPIFGTHSLHLNEVRKNLAAPGKPLLPSPKSAYFWCSIIGTPHRYLPVGDLDRSPLDT
jgi:hypothetical protein